MRKLTSLLLALLLLVMPLSSLAASPAELVAQAVDQGRAKTTTITLTPGTLPLDANTSVVVSDMLSALGFSCTTYQQDGEYQTDAALSLSGKDVLTFSVAGQKDLTYIASSLMGDRVAAFNADEAMAFAEKLITLIGQSSAMTEEQIAQAKEQIAAAFATGSAQAVTLDGMDFTPVADYVAKLMEKVEYTEVTQQPRNSDPAVKMGTLVLTADDIADLYVQIFAVLKQNTAFMDQMAKMGTMTVDDDEKPMTFEEFTVYAPEKIRTTMASFEDTIATFYLDDQDEEVYATIVMKSKAGAEDPAELNLEYSRLTTADGVGHAVNATVTDDDDTVGITASLLTGSETLDLFTLNIVAMEDGKDDVNVCSLVYQNAKDRTDTTAHDQATLDIAVTPTTDDDDAASVGTVSMRMTADVQAAFDGKDATKDVTVALFMGDSEEALLTADAHVSTGDAPQSIAVADAVRPGQMTDEEFNTYAGEVLQSAQLNLVTLLQSLPTSVLKLFTSGK